MSHTKRRWALRAVLFCAVVVGAHLLLRHFYLAEVLAAGGSPIERDRAYVEDSESIRIGLLGNSHTFLSLYPTIIPASRNYGSLGEGYMVTYYRLKRILDEDPDAFSTVILQVDLHSFCGNQIDQGGNPYWACHVDYVDLARTTGAYGQCGREWLQTRAFPYAGSTRDLTRYLLSAMSEPVPAETPLDRDYSAVEDPKGKAWNRAARHFMGQRWFDKGVADYFERILDLCAEAGIQVVLVEFPVTEHYLNEAKRILPVDEWREKVDACVNGRPGVTLLRCRELYFGQDELFGDPDHLNARGSALFSEYVRDDLVRRGII